MTEQTRNITEAVIAQNQSDRLDKIRRKGAERQIKRAEKYLKVLRSLHLYGSTVAEVEAHKSDSYFSTWFKDVEKGDIHVMHSILDHFEPLEIITNLGHNYRSKFSKDSAEIVLDFRPEAKLPKSRFFLEDNDITSKLLEGSDKENVVKSYLYSSILRIVKELTLYFPLHQISFVVNCSELGMQMQPFNVTTDQMKYFLENEFDEEFNQKFEHKILS